MVSDSKTNSIVNEDEDEEVEFTKQANDRSNTLKSDFEDSEDEEVDLENNGIIEF